MQYVSLKTAHCSAWEMHPEISLACAEKLHTQREHEGEREGRTDLVRVNRQVYHADHQGSPASESVEPCRRAEGAPSTTRPSAEDLGLEGVEGSKGQVPRRHLSKPVEDRVVVGKAKPAFRGQEIEFLVAFPAREIFGSVRRHCVCVFCLWRKTSRQPPRRQRQIGSVHVGVSNRFLCISRPWNARHLAPRNLLHKTNCRGPTNKRGHIVGRWDEVETNRARAQGSKD